MMKLARGVLALLFLAALSACSTSGAVTSDPRSPDVLAAAEAAIAASPHLYILEGGIIARPLDNGAAVPIAKEISTEFFLAPYPPTSESRLNIYLFDPRSGVPITNADVMIQYEMLYMDHGQHRLTATENGNGRYLAPLEFGMYGDWIVDVYARSGEQAGSVRLEIIVAP